MCCSKFLLSRTKISCHLSVMVSNSGSKLSPRVGKLAKIEALSSTKGWVTSKYRACLQDSLQNNFNFPLKVKGGQTLFEQFYMLVLNRFLNFTFYEEKLKRGEESSKSWTQSQRLRAFPKCWERKQVTCPLTSWVYVRSIPFALLNSARVSLWILPLSGPTICQLNQVHKS